MMVGFVLKGYEVEVVHYSTSIYYAASRGRAMAQAWRHYADVYGVSFGDFLRRARVRRWRGQSQRFGEPMTILGLPAFYVGHNSQYIQFVRPDSDVILNAHPLDVEPPTARRGTPYFQELEAAHG